MGQLDPPLHRQAAGQPRAAAERVFRAADFGDVLRRPGWLQAALRVGHGQLHVVHGLPARGLDVAEVARVPGAEPRSPPARVRAKAGARQRASVLSNPRTPSLCPCRSFAALRRPSPSVLTERKSGKRRMAKGKPVAALVAGLVLVLAACAPSAPGQRAQSEGRADNRAGPPKTLRIGSIREPVDGIALFGGTGDANAQYGPIFHAGLTAFDSQGALVPRLAEKVPSVDDGDWKLLPDGGME